MRAGKQSMRIGLGVLFSAVLTLILAACSKPEEVIRSRIAQANQNLADDRVPEAVATLEKLDQRYPRQPAVLEALGYAYARAGRHREAAADFIAAADLDPGRERLRQFAAESYQRDGALDLAAEQHRIFLNKHPDDFQSWQHLGEIEEERGNLRQAVESYLKWYRLRPNGTAAYRIATGFRRLNNAPQARTWFETTIRHTDAPMEEAFLGILGIEIEAGDFAAAEKTVGQIDTNFPNAINASPLAGVRERIAAWKEAEAAVAAQRAEQERLTREIEAARQKQQDDLARAMIQEAEATRSQTPSTPPAATTPEPTPPAPVTTTQTSTEPARAPAETKSEAVRAMLETAAQKSVVAVEIEAPAELPPAVQAAVTRKEAGEVEKATEILWRALAEDAGNVPAWVELADCYRLLKQFTTAESCILEARRYAPDSIEVETAYLNVVRESQPAEVYVGRLEAARRKFPANANLAYALARALSTTDGDTAGATAAYNDFLMLAHPNDPRRDEASQFVARGTVR